MSFRLKVTKPVDVTVEVDVADLDTQDLIDELECRGWTPDDDMPALEDIAGYNALHKAVLLRHADEHEWAFWMCTDPICEAMHGMSY